MLRRYAVVQARSDGGIDEGAKWRGEAGEFKTVFELQMTVP